MLLHWKGPPGGNLLRPEPHQKMQLPMMSPVSTRPPSARSPALIDILLPLSAVSAGSPAEADITAGVASAVGLSALAEPEAPPAVSTGGVRGTIGPASTGRVGG